MARVKNEYKKIYPINLLTEMLGEGNELINEINTSEDKRNGLEYSISLLTDRHRTVLNMFYRENVSATSIGEKFGITKSRVYDIRNEALRKIRRSDNYKYAIYGLEGAKLLERKRAKEQEAKFEKEKANFPNLSFEYLQPFLTPRSWNCLWRHSAIKKIDFTIGDLERMSDDELKTFRNLGETSLFDIRMGIEKAKAKYGIKNAVTAVTYSDQFNSIDDIINACIERIDVITQDDRNFVAAVKQKYKELKEQE